MAMPQNDISPARNRSQSDDLKTWRSYADAGLSLVPIATDGTKSPAWQALPQEWNAEEGRMKHVWKPFQTRQPTDAEIVEWASKRLGIGIVGGKISRFFEALDNDEVPLWTPYVALVKTHAPTLYQRLVF